MRTVKQVFPTLDFLGWYSVGSTPSSLDLSIHNQVSAPRPHNPLAVSKALTHFPLVLLRSRPSFSPRTTPLSSSNYRLRLLQLRPKRRQKSRTSRSPSLRLSSTRLPRAEEHQHQHQQLPSRMAQRGMYCSRRVLGRLRRARRSESRSRESARPGSRAERGRAVVSDDPPLGFMYAGRRKPPRRRY